MNAVQVASRPLDVLNALRRMAPQVRCGAIPVDSWMSRAGVLRDIEQRVQDLQAHVVRYGNEWRGARA
jgi:hypothetical protein